MNVSPTELMRKRGLEPVVVTGDSDSELGKSEELRAAESGAVDARIDEFDADLGRLIDVWPMLSAEVKARILALAADGSDVDVVTGSG